MNHQVRYRDNVGIHPRDFLPFNLYYEVIRHSGPKVALRGRGSPNTHQYFFAFAFGQPDGYWQPGRDLRGSVIDCPAPTARRPPLSATV